VDEKLLRSSLRARSDCPTIEVLSVQITGLEGNDARAGAELHLRECLHCRTELELLHRFEEGAIGPEEAADVKWISARLTPPTQIPFAVKPVRWWEAWRLPKAAFALAGVAVVALFGVAISSEWRLQRTMSRPVPEFAEEVQRSRAIEIVPRTGYFEWQPVAGASHYELTVRKVDESVVFYNSFTETALAFPPNVAELVRAAKLLEWEVVARDSAGNEIAKSGVQRLRQPAERTK
jgi:hypothetical protein